MNGILIVNKPIGYTSRDVVNIIGKKFGTKKVGHTGTLDPLASGVLVICIGRYTKLVDLLTSLDKEYIAEIKLGIETDTLDITGNIIKEKDFLITEEQIKNVFAKFIGKYEMEVPAYSAIKVNGKKLYEYARNNIEVKLPVKEVKINSLELLAFNGDIIKFKTEVEKGTYIRSLIRDLSKSLNTVGTMQSLIRTKQGNFLLENAYTLEDIENNNYKILSAQEVLKIKSYELKEDEYLKVKNGNKITLSLNEEYLYLNFANKEVAIYKKEQEYYKPYVMLI